MAFSLGAIASQAGYRLESYDSIGSTNDAALAAARSGEDGPMWFVTGHQVTGRGRRGRSWEGPPGNLAASLLLFTPAPIHVAVTLGFVAGLSLHDALSQFDLAGTEIRLKWPNDVLANGAKLSGILLESEANRQDRTGIVVGIGVNVVSAPSGVSYGATCLADLGVPLDAEPLFAALSDAWCERYRQWETGLGMEAIRLDWLDRAAGVGGPVAITSGTETIRGDFETLDVEGRLIVRRANGSRFPVSAGEVHFGGAASTTAAG